MSNKEIQDAEALVDAEWDKYLTLCREVDFAKHHNNVCSAAFNAILPTSKWVSETEEFKRMSDARGALQKAIDARNASAHKHSELFAKLWRMKDAQKAAA